MLCLHADCSQPAIGHQPSQPSRSAVWDVEQWRICLFVDSFINRCYLGLLVSGSVRVRVRVRVRVSVSVTARAGVSARVTVTDRDRNRI